MIEGNHNQSKIDHEIVQLGVAAQWGELSDAGANRLNALLGESETARRNYVSVAHDTQVLREWAAEYVIRTSGAPRDDARQKTVDSVPSLDREHLAFAVSLRRLGGLVTAVFHSVWRTVGAFALVLAIAAAVGLVGRQFEQINNGQVGNEIEQRGDLNVSSGVRLAGTPDNLATVYGRVPTEEEITSHLEQ